MEQTITLNIDPQLVAFIVGFALAGLLFLLVFNALKKRFLKLIKSVQEKP